MDDFDDEMLFDSEAWHEVSVPLPADNDNRQWQQGSIDIASRDGKSSRAASPGAQSQPVPMAIESIKKLTYQNGVPDSPKAQNTPKNAQVSSGGKRDRTWLINRIEHIFEQQVDGILSKDQQLAVTVKLRPRSLEAQSSSAIRQFRFPGKSEKEAWRYTVIIRILELIRGALVEDTIITKRDIYYRDPALFSKQSVVDRFVDDLAYTFGVPRMLVNVTATAKGLIAGRFRICRNDGAVTDGRSEREGLLITALKDDETIDVSLVQWVLIVEKEATFRSLVSSSFWDKLSSHGLLVTGKGFPDIATRLFLRSIALPSAQNSFKQPPVSCLVDYDPDGLDILSTYKHGSAALAHEKASLALPMIQWLGLSSSDIAQGGDLHHDQGLLRLSARDRRKATRMLEREVFSNLEVTWKIEVQKMLMLNVKAEMQLLEAPEGGLVEWLKQKDIA